jgi:hypothetical protein
VARSVISWTTQKTPQQLKALPLRAKLRFPLSGPGSPPTSHNYVSSSAPPALRHPSPIPPNPPPTLAISGSDSDLLELYPESVGDPPRESKRSTRRVLQIYPASVRDVSREIYSREC